MRGRNRTLFARIRDDSYAAIGENCLAALAHADAADGHRGVLRLNYAQGGLAARCRVTERWIAHVSSLETRVEPVRRIEVPRLRWYVGLDGASTKLLNDLYNGDAPDEAARHRFIALMSLRFADESSVLEEAKGHPCYLVLAMDERNSVRMKPQNILPNLPLRRRA